MYTGFFKVDGGGSKRPILLEGTGTYSSRKKKFGNGNVRKWRGNFAFHESVRQNFQEYLAKFAHSQLLDKTPEIREVIPGLFSPPYFFQ